MPKLLGVAEMVELPHIHGEGCSGVGQIYLLCKAGDVTRGSWSRGDPLVTAAACNMHWGAVKFLLISTPW